MRVPDQSSTVDMLRRVLAFVLGLTFVGAAVGKAIDPWQASIFARYTVTGGQEPGAWWAALAITILAAEAWLGLLLMFGRAGRTVLALVGAMLGLFTLALVRGALDGSAPSCGCFGPLVAGAEREYAAGIVRNAGLLAITLWLMIVVRHGSKPHARAAGGGPRSHDRAARAAAGFTLLEMLVVIAIVAAIVGILLPVLGSAKREAEGIDSMSMMRQATASLSMYAADYRDAFPYFATPRHPDAPITIGQYTFGRGGYFGIQSKYWTALIVPEYLDVLPETLSLNDARARSSVALGPPDAPGLYTSRYWLTHGAHARPGFWHAEADSNPTHFQGSGLADTAFPGSKGLLLDVLAGTFDEIEAKEDRDVAFIGLADGSARAERWSALIDARRFVELRPHGAVGWPILSTSAGLAGRDFE